MWHQLIPDRRQQHLAEQVARGKNPAKMRRVPIRSSRDLTTDHQLTENPAAKMTVQEIVERVRRAQPSG